MRISIDIDEKLLADAMKATGQATKKASVEEALRRVVRRKEVREAIEDMAGLGWEGDLEKMREERSFEDEE